MQSKRALARVLALLLSFALVAAACGSDDDDGDDEGTGTEQTDGETGDSGSLTGMRGTTPLTDLGDEFKQRLDEIDPELQDYNYAAESYDAVIVIALAAQLAGTDGIEMASEINGVTRGGEKCEDYASCLAIIDAGGDPDYDGASGAMEFSGNGEPTVASYAILEFGQNGCEDSTECLDDDKTSFVQAEAPASADVEPVAVEGERAGDGVLTIGTLLPITGSLAFLGPPEFAGVNLAIAEINDNGGFGDQDVVMIEGDSGDTDNGLAPATVSDLLGQNVDAIVGAASSSVSLSVVDSIVAAGVVMFSPANTSKKFSTYDDKGLYFRNAPSDILQGQVLADTIIADGNSSVYILALNDDYGTGLVDDLTAALEEGGAEVLGNSIYDPKAADFSTEVQAAKDADAAATVLIGFDESSKVLAKMVEQGIDISSVYGVDGNMGNALAANFEAGT